MDEEKLGVTPIPEEPIAEEAAPQPTEAAQAAPTEAAAQAAEKTPEQTEEKPQQPTQRTAPQQGYAYSPVTGQPTGAYRYAAPGQTAYGAQRMTPQQYSTYTGYARPQPNYAGYTQQSAYAQPTRQTTEPQPKKKEKKKVSHVWIPILIVVALLLGIGGGAAGYWIATGHNRAAATQQGEVPKETLAPSETPKESNAPISDNVHSNAADGSYSPAQIYSDYVNAVVGIASESTGRNVWGQTVTQASAGSGFIITSDGYVVTNYHVIEGANNITVQLHDGSEYPATVVGYENSNCDVALLKIDAQDLPTVSIGDSSSICVGEQVCAIGNPLGELTFTLTVGYISALNREVNTDGSPINMFQTDAAINAGNSGGPLFDMDGNVIGITTAKYSGSTASGATVEGVGFAIPINDVMAIIDDLTQYGYVTGKPYLGVSVADSAYYGQNLPAGAYIAEVVDGCAAQKAGLQVGDVIVGVGGSVVGSRSDLQTALSAFKAGDTVDVTVYRDGQYLKLSLTLDERPRDADTQTQQPTEEQPTEEQPQESSSFGFGGWPFP